MKENFISCVLWVQKGVSKSVPDEVKLSPEELKALIQETRKDIKDIEPDFKDNEDLDVENEAEDKEEGEENDENKSEEDGDEDNFEIDEVSEESHEDDTEEKHVDTKDEAMDSDEDIISKYDLDNYDDNDDGRPCMNIDDVTMFVDNKDDEYMVESNSEDEDKKEEEEDMQIKINDNLLIAGHIDGERCTVEVHVYNKEEDDFYVHHEMDMATFPVALEWMDFHPSEDERDEPLGSYVAVGDMTPVISVWDLDVVGASVPDYCLGKKPSKKEKKTTLKGHTERVVSLSWNKQLRSILASGSADKTIILWDLLNCRGEKLLKYHEGDVQALEWDPFEYDYLLSGCTAGLIRIYDYRTGSKKAARKWSVEGEIERVCWNKSQSSKFLCSTDQGFVYSFDINVSTYQHCIKAHKDSVTALDISPDYPNLLMTGGYDQLIKVWDLDLISNQSDEALTPVYSQKTVVAKIYAAKFAPDSELVVAVGGHASSHNLKIVDLGELKPGIKIEEQDESASHSPTSLKKKKKKLKKFHHLENGMAENVDESVSCSLTSQKKKKLEKFHSNCGQQSTNDAAGPSFTKPENADELDERASHSSASLKKKKKLKKLHSNGGLPLTQNEYAANPSSTENGMAENIDESVSHSLTSQKKQKLKKFHSNCGQQSTNNDAAGPSCTKNDMAQSASHSPSHFQLKKMKKKRHERFHPYEQQNAYSADPNCTEENTNLVAKKRKRKHNQIN